MHCRLIFFGNRPKRVLLSHYNKEQHGLILPFKMYDFKGQNRINDEQPHLKWINRIFLFNSIYLAFGFDDFVSKDNKSIFLGAGFRFGDDDLKYFLPNFIGTG